MTRKITRGLARIKLGFQDCLYLGNLDSKRDWGHARDYVELMHLMLQQEQPKDYVIATGQQYSVRDFVDVAGKEVGFDIRWEGDDVDEKGYERHTENALLPLTNDTTVPLKWKPFWGMPVSPGKCWAGNPRPHFRRWWPRWWLRI